METQKIINLLNGSDNEDSKFATKKWYIINDESKGNYSQENVIKFLTQSIESSLCDYSDAYILVTGNTGVTGGNENTKVAFKNCASFNECSTEINGTRVDELKFINIIMPMYNLIEYSDNYSDTSGSLWFFKRDEINTDANVSPANSSSFKYKSSFIGNTEADRTKNGVKIAVPLKYLSNFWRSLEIPLINYKVELSLEWTGNCLLSGGENINDAGAVANAGTAATFKITDAKLHVPIVTLSAEDNAKLSNLLSKGFESSVYWNECNVLPERNCNANAVIREIIDSSCQGNTRLFVFAYAQNAAVSSHQKYFLPRIEVKNYNIEIDGRNFYDQPSNNQETNYFIKQYDEIRKISIRQGDDYKTGSLLDFAYFKNNYKLIVAALSKQKVLDADPRAIQQIIFTGKASDATVIYYVYEKSNETILKFSK